MVFTRSFVLIICFFIRDICSAFHNLLDVVSAVLFNSKQFNLSFLLKKKKKGNRILQINIELRR
jgi:uncharacterized protein YydD (DUF2326 family)